jgi:hypothetical protein
MLCLIIYLIYFIKQNIIYFIIIYFITKEKYNYDL